MSECCRDFFLHNGFLKSSEKFLHYFGRPLKYSYEVFRVQQGVPLFIQDHLERLWLTAQLENTVLPYSRQDLLNDIFKVVQANSPGDGNIKIAIEHRADNQVSTLIYFTPHQYPTPEQFKFGVAVKLFFAERQNPNAKVMDVDLRSATDQAKSIDSVYEVLLVDREGFITEGSRSNVFFIKDNLLITPPFETVLEGVTRKQIMHICSENNIAVHEEKFHHSSLSQANALFISGTSRRVLPVNKVDELTFSTSHPLLQRLQHLLERRMKKYLLNLTGF